MIGFAILVTLKAPVHKLASGAPIDIFIRKIDKVLLAEPPLGFAA
jgi:hypothetical protein